MKQAPPLIQLNRIAGGIALFMAIAFGSACAPGDEGPKTSPGQVNLQTSQPSLVGSLCEDDVLADNVFAVRRAGHEMSVEERYEFLRGWVLPSVRHSNFRLTGKQTPTDPVVPVIDDHPFDIERQRAAAERGQRRIHTGGNLVSPAFDLIETAKELGKLDELRNSVRVSGVSSEVQQRCRISMLAMIDMAKGDAEAAQLEADQLYNRFLNQRFPQLADRMPETLFACMAAETGLLTDDAMRFLSSIVDSQIRAQKFNGPSEWDRLIASLVGRIRYQKLPASEQAQTFTAAPELKSWHRATRIHSWGNGNGIPAGHMQLSDGAIETLANMDDEYLFFASPLRGNYTLECDCTGFGWKEIFPFVAGSWIFVAHNHDAVQLGELYKVVGSVPVDPKLSRVDDWIHFRVDVRDGECFRFINSRLVSRESLPKEHDPWVALRNPGGGSGSLRNLRIRGNPVIPEQVTISEHRTSSWRTDAAAPQTLQPVTHLHGWMPWIEDPWYPEKMTWQLEEDPSGATQIVGHRRPELAGTAAERLLRYQWPVVWNSRITYEFFYSDGESLVHPAIGRQALLLSRDGVKTHWVTNGIWDSATLDPLNSTSEGNRALTTPLPFKENAWNELTLNLNDDELAVSLNGTTVFEGELDPTNDRTLGLFYYCDQSEARVRNVVLNGDWPKTLPPVDEQELRDTDTDVLDRERVALADSFEFDFTNKTEEELQSKFVIADGKRQPVRIQRVVDGQLVSSYQQLNRSEWDVFLKPDGLHMRGEAAPKQGSTSSVGPRIMVTGDFDVIAEFADLQLTPTDNGLGAIYLGPRVIRKDSEAHLLFRGVVQHPDTPLRQLTQVEISASGKNGFRYVYPFIKTEECTAGRLRIARRADKFFYLIACLDSDQFHLLHSRDTTDIPILPGNFLLRTSCYSQGTLPARVNVVWKNVSIRATSIATVFELADASQPVTEQNVREKVDFSD